MIQPNLIIIGAPKCGTSSLFNWINAHPQAFGSIPKETFFFMDEDNPLLNRGCNFHHHGLEKYTQFYSGCNAEHKIIFEATTHYLYQQTALQQIAEFDEIPQIVIVIRKPSNRIYSSFQYSLNNLAAFDQKIDFAEYTHALLQNDQSYSKYVNRDDSAYVLVRDLDYSDYGKYLSLWYDAIPNEKIRILLFEEMISSPVDFMKYFCIQLRIDPDFYANFDFSIKNPTHEISHKQIHRSASKVASLIPQSKAKQLAKQLYLKLQGKSYNPGDKDRYAIETLDLYFESRNQLLSSKYGLDLSLWQ